MALPRSVSPRKVGDRQSKLAPAQWGCLEQSPKRSRGLNFSGAGAYSMRQQRQSLAKAAPYRQRWEHEQQHQQGGVVAQTDVAFRRSIERALFAAAHTDQKRST